MCDNKNQKPWTLTCDRDCDGVMYGSVGVDGNMVFVCEKCGYLKKTRWREKRL